MGPFPNVVPAHLTKHLSTLTYPIADRLFLLSQLDDGQSNGTALWLGAQCLSAFLAHNIPPGSRPRVVELGSGIGLTAYVRTLQSRFTCLSSTTIGLPWQLWAVTS